ncbi:MAG TPA: cytochrome c oxidase subunit 3 [Thiothrix sp.]|nr:cytochrome c oxidase subunit 3 [Thiothrix sp.]
MQSQEQYYVPTGSYWPILGSVGMAALLGGFASSLHGSGMGTGMMVLGFAIIIFMVFGWMGQVVNESEAGTYNLQVDQSFRMGMGWFIFSEVMFFAAFFGALYYVRNFAVPWLGGAGNNAFTPTLYPEAFKSVWPLINMPLPENFSVPKGIIHAWEVPAINTLLLLTSGATITWAHWGLKNNHRNNLIGGLIATILLGITFLGFQAAEYAEAYMELGLTLKSGIYGSTFFMLTGFHGFHVFLGTLMLTVILMRVLRGHFNSERNFGFEAVAWYWHFVDVVWLGLFIFVYWI